MIVVDTSVWIDYLRDADDPRVETLASLDSAEIIVGDLVLLEVLQGARTDQHASGLEDELRRFRIVPMTSPALAVEAARIYRALRAEGVTIRKTVDLAIATFCIANGHALLQSDRDFEAIARRFPLRLI
ncbi:type II toxin-antitoxin system VapC family toxin [Aureimonas leprariae]|uniref:Ribonuclease VapC n=1 Tax=Plantimonas leprariae TaxID=2615207 RepID=A0A7V7PP60_9HYPH|nr:PIN domain nuclease [Aureimonas leprariae]KAB0679700.1 PIN domain nuclease [Aureimonas leprariae]